jgi:hypothetical protein
LILKVFYEHVEWQACSTGIQDENRGGPGRGDYETFETVVVFDRLHSYSVYKIEVKALPPPGSSHEVEQLNIMGETVQDVPDVMPEKSSIDTRDVIHQFNSMPTMTYHYNKLVVH